MGRRGRRCRVRAQKHEQFWRFTPGFTVLIPRCHLSSDILSLEDRDFIPLIRAAHHVSLLLKDALGVERVGMFFEGYEINYAHVKLLPVPTELEEGGRSNTVETFCSQYPGFVTTQPGPERDMAKSKLNEVGGLGSYAASIESDFKKLFA